MYKLILLACFCTVLGSCNQNKLRVSDKNAEDFNVFYKQFYKDSAFQWSRIKFPLNGQWGTMVDLDSGDKRRFYRQTWTQDNWVMESEPDHADQLLRFKKTYRLDTVIDQTYIAHTYFSITRYFVLDKGKWYLTFYTFSDSL